MSMSSPSVQRHAGASQMQTIDPHNDKTISIYRSVEYRREMQQKERDAARARRERQLARRGMKHTGPRTAITVDTSKARSNIDVVRLCLKELHWREYPMGRRDLNCDIFWHGVNVPDYSSYYTGQINRFPGMGEILAKINLFRTLDLMRRIFPNDYDFYPKTWLLPHQYQDFCSEVMAKSSGKRKAKLTYIVKPSEGSQGDGIYLLKDPQDYSLHGNRSHVVQEYLSDPLLLEKFKFDLRIYVILKSLDPLEFLIAKEGMVRFCTVPYQRPTYKNMHESYMHLTNYSLNKHSSTYNSSERDDEGSKRTLSSVLAKMETLGLDTSTLLEAIERLVSKTIMAITPELLVAYQAHIPAGKPGPSCFQILGFDILLLRDLKPMLLEVNSCPSLRTVSEQEIGPGVVTYLPCLKDEEIKRPIVRDTLLLIAPKHKLDILKKERRERRRERRRLQVKLTNRKDDRSGQPEKDVSPDEERMDITQTMEPTQATSINIISDADKAGEGDRPKSVFDHTEKRPASTPMALFQFHDEDGEHDVEGHADRANMTFQQIANLRFDDNESDEDVDVEDSDNDSEGESCLKQLYPAMYQEEYDRLRILEKVAHIFITSLGVKGSWRIGLTGFRMFTRKCRLGRRKLSSAAIDILYIDFQKKWDYLNPDRTSGLCYQGFVDAFMEIARRKFYSADTMEMLENLVDYCEANMVHNSHSAPYVNRRLLGRRPKKHPTRLSYDDSMLGEVERVHISIPPTKGQRYKSTGLYGSTRALYEAKE